MKLWKPGSFVPWTIKQSSNLSSSSKMMSLHLPRQSRWLKKPKKLQGWLRRQSIGKHLNQFTRWNSQCVGNLYQCGSSSHTCHRIPWKVAGLASPKVCPWPCVDICVSVYNKLSRSFIFQLDMHTCMFLFVCVFVCQFTIYHEDGLSLGGTGAVEATNLLGG